MNARFVISVFITCLFFGQNLFSVIHQDSSHECVSEEKVSFVIFTEEYPPFSYKENGELTGSSTEIIREIFKQLKITNYKILLLDWELSYDFVQYIPNSMIYSLAKTSSRKENFKWAGPIATNYWYIFADNENAKTRNIKLNNLADANKYSISVQKYGVLSMYLKSKGIDNLTEARTCVEAVKNLIDGKVDLLAISEVVGYSIIKKLKKPTSILKRIYTLKRHDLYIGFNPEIPDSMVEKVQAALDKMKKDGSYDKIMNKYYDQIYN